MDHHHTMSDSELLELYCDLAANYEINRRNGYHATAEGAASAALRVGDSLRTRGYSKTQLCEHRVTAILNIDPAHSAH